MFNLYDNKNRFPRFPVERPTDVALSFHVFRKNNVAGCENPAGAITDLDLETAFQYHNVLALGGVMPVVMIVAIGVAEDEAGDGPRRR